MENGKLKKHQYGFVGQEFKIALAKHKDRELTEAENRFIDELNFALVLPTYDATMFERTIKYFKELQEEIRTNKIKQLKKELEELEVSK